MVKRWFLYAAIALACIVSYLFFQQWLSWLILQCVLWLPVVSLLLSLPVMLRCRAELRCASAVSVGAKNPIRIYVYCPLPRPGFWGRISVENTITGESWLLKTGELLPTSHCGRLVCRGDRIQIYDYLGLFRLKLRGTRPVSVNVRPLPLAMKKMPELERELSVVWQPKPGGGFAENHEIRLYRPGDSLNQIHWKLTAKTGKLMIREAMVPQQRGLQITMVLNGSPEELARKLGRFLWLGNYIVEHERQFILRAATGNGEACYSVRDAAGVLSALDDLMGHTPAPKGTVVAFQAAAWQYHIGGEPDA